jgi:hypothetical protein
VAPRSYYGTGGSRCSWRTTTTVATTNEEGECAFIQPENSMEIMLFVAVFSGLVSAPFAVFIDWVIHKVLAAPEINELLMMNLRQEKESFPKSNQFTSVLPVANVNNIAVRSGSSFSFNSFKRTLFSRRHSSMTVQRYQQCIDKDYHDLLREILEYRQTIVQDKEIGQEIDRLWGFTPECIHRAWEDEPEVNQQIAQVGHCSNNIRMRGLFRKLQDVVTSALVNSQSISKSLQQELAAIYNRLEKEKVKFELLKTETVKSKRLLFLFQKDLIPGITGEILESKEQRDNVILEPVSARMKVIGWIFLGGLNLGMLFYVFLFAVSQDSHRQIAWGRSLGIYLLLDIVLISTVMVIFMHVLLPSLIMRDVGKIKKKMIESIERFYESIGKEKKEEDGNRKSERKSTEDDDDNEDNNEKDQLHRKKQMKPLNKEKIVKSGQEDKIMPAFNAAKYLFLSYRLASIYPDLKASQIILSYSSPWPKQDYQHITNVKSDYSGRYSAITRSISIIVIFFLTNLLATPIAIHDMIFQIATTAMMGYTLFVHLQLYYIYPVLVMIPTVFICAVGYGIRYYYNSIRKEKTDDNNPNKIAPSSNPQPAVGQTQLTTLRQSLQQGIQLASQLQNNLLRTTEEQTEEQKKGEPPDGRVNSDDEEEVVEEELSLASFSSHSLSAESVPSDFGKNNDKNVEMNTPNNDNYHLIGKGDPLLEFFPSAVLLDDDVEMNMSDSKNNMLRNITEISGNDTGVEEVGEIKENKDDKGHEENEDEKNEDEKNEDEENEDEENEDEENEDEENEDEENEDEENEDEDSEDEDDIDMLFNSDSSSVSSIRSQNK